MNAVPAASTGKVPPRALLLLAVLTLTWGTSWSLFPVAVREISVWTFRSIAIFSSGMVLLGFARLRGQSLAVPREHWPTLAVAAVLYLTVWNFCTTYAAVLLPSGQAALLGSTMPLWLALINWGLFRARPSRRLALALALGTGAVALLATQNLASYADAPLGFVVGILSAIGWACGTLVLTRHPIPVPAAVLTGWQSLVAAVPLAIGAVAFREGHAFMPSWQTIAVIGYLVIVPISIGNVCWFSIVGLLPASISSLSPILVPVIAMITGAIVHGEPLGPLQWLAMACSVSALTLALFRPASPSARGAATAASRPRS
ncbi:MAG: DMT family transporter [Burkholderiaceae bacterium]